MILKAIRCLIRGNAGTAGIFDDIAIGVRREGGELPACVLQATLESDFSPGAAGIDGLRTHLVDVTVLASTYSDARIFSDCVHVVLRNAYGDAPYAAIQSVERIGEDGVPNLDAAGVLYGINQTFRVAWQGGAYPAS